MIQSVGALTTALSVMNQERVPKDFSRRMADVIARVKIWGTDPDEYPAQGLEVGIQVGAYLKHEEMTQTEGAIGDVPVISCVRKTFADAATQCYDLKKQRMEKRMSVLEMQLERKQAYLNQRVKEGEEDSQNKDRMIASLRVEIARLTSELSKPPAVDDKTEVVERLKAQVKHLQVQTELLKTEMKALREKKTAPRDESAAIAVQKPGISLRDIARLRQQIMIEALRFKELPREFILPLSEIEKLCRSEKDVDAAIWRAWWARIADAMNALKAPGPWTKRWIYAIIQFAESASPYFQEHSDQISVIMEAFWRGEKNMSGSEEEVKALFKASPILAITCWMTEAEEPWKVYAKICQNMLSFIPKVLYWRYDRSIGGYSTETLIDKTLVAGNMSEALQYLYETNDRIVHELVVRKSRKNPFAFVRWQQLSTQGLALSPVLMV